MLIATRSVIARASLDPPVVFEEFYRLHADRVHRALALTLGDHHLAQEATDEAMARAYLHWARVSNYDNLGGWVYRVGLNAEGTVKSRLSRGIEALRTIYLRTEEEQ